MAVLLLSFTSGFHQGGYSQYLQSCSLLGLRGEATFFFLKIVYLGARATPGKKARCERAPQNTVQAERLFYFLPLYMHNMERLFLIGTRKRYNAD